MKPVIALIGRPNVGKSTLFNQITKSRDALVADFAGLTRDRKYGDAVYQNKSFIVVDTGGIGENEGGIDTYMAEQSKTAIHEADIIIFVVDARAGLLASDEQIARELRTLGKKVYLVANKVDGVHAEAALVEFYKLGMGEPIQVAASHGRGVQQMLEEVLAEVPEDENPEEHNKNTGLRLAIIGRPNVGKSTLVNRLLGEERVVAFDQPGTTRDSIYIPFERDGRQYTLIDTAGVRRKGKVDEMIDTFNAELGRVTHYTMLPKPVFNLLCLLGITDNAPGIIKAIDHGHCFLKQLFGRNHAGVVQRQRTMTILKPVV